jgi:hypothetical protein
VEIRDTSKNAVDKLDFGFRLRFHPWTLSIRHGWQECAAELLNGKDLTSEQNGGIFKWIRFHG